MQGNREEPVVLNAFWFTVTQITGKIKYLLEDSIQPLWIMGELSNVKLHRPSGHLYFSLRDKDSTLRSVMFRRDVVSLGFQPVEGEMVLEALKKFGHRWGFTFEFALKFQAFRCIKEGKHVDWIQLNELCRMYKLPINPTVMVMSKRLYTSPTVRAWRAE